VSALLGSDAITVRGAAELPLPTSTGCSIVRPKAQGFWSATQQTQARAIIDIASEKDGDPACEGEGEGEDEGEGGFDHEGIVSLEEVDAEARQVESASPLRCSSDRSRQPTDLAAMPSRLMLNRWKHACPRSPCDSPARSPPSAALCRPSWLPVHGRAREGGVSTIAPQRRSLSPVMVARHGCLSMTAHRP